MQYIESMAIPLKLSILELQGSCYQKQPFENADPAFSWTFTVREIVMDKLPSDN